MKSPYIADLQPNQIATGVFLVSFKDIRTKKTGEPFLNLTLCDRTGDVDAKMWDNADKVMDTFERNDFVRVKGLPQVFQNRLQFTVHTLVRVSESDVDYTDYFPASERNAGEMFAELLGIVGSIQNAHLKALLEAVFADESIARRFQQAPAAKTIHHAWLGGLLEHVLSLCNLARTVGPHYPFVDTDLLLTGAILHDIGKIEELSWERGFSYTDSGQLIGHIVQGLRIIDEKARAVPGFPPRLKTLLDHMIVAHHGELEFGSPKVPLFAEALLLHFLDNLDSKLDAIRRATLKDRQIEGTWSSLVPGLDRYVLKKDRYLNGAAEEPAAPPVSAPAPPVASAPVVSPAPAPASEAPAAPAVEPRTADRRTPQDSVFAERLKVALGGK
jgi:3'-5' exoribonuclease